MRIDQNFSPGHTLFGRFSWKERRAAVADDVSRASGRATDEKPNHTLVISDNFAFSANLLNEARFGFTRADQSFTTGRRGLDVIARSRPDAPARPTLPDVHRHDRRSTSPATRRFGESQEEPLTQDTWQIADTVTWLSGRHTMKGGFDIKWFNWTSPVNFTGADDFGVFRFNNNIQGGGTGHPVANFLLGLPTDVDQTASGPNVDGVATHYGVLRAGRVAR